MFSSFFFLNFSSLFLKFRHFASLFVMFLHVSSLFDVFFSFSFSFHFHFFIIFLCFFHYFSFLQVFIPFFFFFHFPFFIFSLFSFLLFFILFLFFFFLFFFFIFFHFLRKPDSTTPQNHHDQAQPRVQLQHTKRSHLRESWRSGTSTTLPGWRYHTGGFWSIPTVHPCPCEGRLWVARQTETTEDRNTTTDEPNILHKTRESRMVAEPEVADRRSTRARSTS